MRSILVLTLLAAVTLAGCSEGGGNDAGDDDPLTPTAPPPEKGLGLIRGVVVDPGIVPIEGATVTLLGTETTQVTDDKGGFIFNDLEPGTYFLEASKIGYAAGAQTTADVVADEANPSGVRIRLNPDPTSLPSAPTRQFDGYLACSASAAVISAPLCAYADGNLGDDVNADIFDMPAVPDYLQGELYWESTQDAGATLQFSVWAGTSFDPVSSVGVSPLSIRLDRETILYGNGTETPGEDLFYDDGQFAWRVFADGVDGSNQNICPDDVPGVVSFSCLSGVGVAIDQAITFYTTEFFGVVPADDWTFVGQGAYVVPPA